MLDGDHLLSHWLNVGQKLTRSNRLSIFRTAATKFSQQEIWRSPSTRHRHVPTRHGETLISRIFFSNFYKSVFSIFTHSGYRKLGFQNSEIIKHLSGESRKLGFQNSEIFKHLSSESRKLGFQKSEIFTHQKTSVF